MFTREALLGRLNATRSLVRGVVDYYVRYLVWTLSLVGLVAVIALLLWFGATGNDKTADAIYEPVPTEEMAAKRAYLHLVQQGPTAIICQQNSSIEPDDASVVFTEANTRIVTLGNCAFTVDDSTGNVIDN